MGGAEGQGAINELIKLASTKKGADGKDGAGLQRPVICICNNVHASALRPLRAVAETVEFRETPATHIATRLR